MENVTIEKLNEAVSQLMDAYEKMKNEKENIENENQNLKDKIKTLENQNDELENNIDDLDNSSEERSSKMNSMLNKIESILLPSENETKSISESFDFDDKNKTDTTKEILSNDEDKQELIEADNNMADLTSPSSDSTKIDLGRMESLLKGL